MCNCHHTSFVNISGCSCHCITIFILTVNRIGCVISRYQRLSLTCRNSVCIQIYRTAAVRAVFLSFDYAAILVCLIANRACQIRRICIIVFQIKPIRLTSVIDLVICLITVQCCCGSDCTEQLIHLSCRLSAGCILIICNSTGN